MSRQQQIFEAFCKANGLKSLPDFKNQRILYGCFSDESVTKEEICNTPDFEGFVDGHEGHSNKYLGPKGTKELDLMVRGLRVEIKGSDITEMMGAQTGDERQKIAKGAIDNSAQLTYEKQYKLGQSMR